MAREIQQGSVIRIISDTKSAEAIVVDPQPFPAWDPRHVTVIQLLQEDPPLLGTVGTVWEEKIRLTRRTSWTQDRIRQGYQNNIANPELRRYFEFTLSQGKKRGIRTLLKI